MHRTLLVAVSLAAAVWAGAPAGPANGRPGVELAATATTARPLSAPKRVRPGKARPAPASPSTVLVPNDPLVRSSWALERAGAPAAWRVTAGSPDVVVAVLDTGVDAHHPDLEGAVVGGWDAVDEDADASDDHGHGTAVAGVIAARGDNGVGGAGVCWRCSLMPVKVIDAGGTGSAADIAEGIVWAADNGADVLNLSFVMSGYDGAVAGAIDYARARGALVVAAAGNRGSDETTFPASHPGVIGVTATDAADARYDWANHGRWVAVAAPGCSQSTLLGGGYGEVCGTSSATAFASGVTALARAADPAAGGEHVAAAIISSALRVGEFVAAGRLDAAAAVGRMRPTALAAPPPPRSDFGPE